MIMRRPAAQRTPRRNVGRCREKNQPRLALACSEINNCVRFFLLFANPTSNTNHPAQTHRANFEEVELGERLGFSAGGASGDGDNGEGEVYGGGLPNTLRGREGGQHCKGGAGCQGRCRSRRPG